MDITPTTTPHTPEYPHKPHRAKGKPITKLSGVAPEHFLMCQTDEILLSEIEGHLTNAELQILHDIMKNGIKKTRKRLLGTTPPHADSPEAEQYERTLRRFLKVEREMQRCGIDIP